MSTFLFASIPVPAHTTNPIPFAQRLVERGHTVLWYAGVAFHEQLRAAGAEPLPYYTAEDFSSTDLQERFPEAARLKGVRAIRWAFADVFVAQATGRVADLQAILMRHRVDAILCDGLMYGVGMVHELGGPAWATFGDGPLPVEDADTPPFGPALQPLAGPVGRLRNRVVREIGRRVVFAPAQRRYDEIRAGLGLAKDPLPVMDAMLSPYLHLQGCTPGFEYPRAHLPGHVHWVGALRPDVPADWTLPPWWGEVTEASRPVVLASQGTIRPDVTELLVPTVRGLADMDVTVVVTTGGAPEQALTAAYGEPLPANVRVAKYVPYDVLLPHVDAFVTNGGYTGSRSPSLTACRSSKPARPRRRPRSPRASTGAASACDWERRVRRLPRLPVPCSACSGRRRTVLPPDASRPRWRRTTRGARVPRCWSSSP